jgi:hypothetical protein
VLARAETGGLQIVVGHASGGDETAEAQMGVGHGSLENIAGPMGDLVRSRPVAAAQRGAEPVDMIDDIVDEWGRQSFPASDPPSNW